MVGILLQILLLLTAILLTVHVPVESLKLPTSSNNESLRKSPLIDMGERSPAPILLLNAAALPKLFGEFYGVIDIKK